VLHVARHEHLIRATIKTLVHRLDPGRFVASPIDHRS
jgi:hypothetical protein